ncbi:hypothetical protein BDN72DRAFT_163537 [Pluteus cervinus]|uniref:Uncharacterized protein n=1 Tax=Pluteus cervinus TaxID=181527 RepID=A0ACD3AK74_9AGAR|nr:hypothetical protein BDN72DRAFT_163537 [Pluteus cervinus]
MFKSKDSNITSNLLPFGQIGHGGQAPSAAALPLHMPSPGGFNSPSFNLLNQPQPQSQSYHVTTSSSSQHNNNSTVTSSTSSTTTVNAATASSSIPPLSSISVSTPKSKSSTSLVSPSLPGVGGSASNSPSGSGSGRPHSHPSSSQITLSSAAPSASSSSSSSRFKPVPPPLSASVSASSSVTIATTTSSASASTSTLTRSTSGASTEGAGGEYIQHHQRIVRSSSYKGQPQQSQQPQQHQQHFNSGSSYQNHPYQQQPHSSPQPTYQQQPHSPLRRAHSHSLSHSQSQPQPLSLSQANLPQLPQQQQRHRPTQSVQSTGSNNSHTAQRNGSEDDLEFEDLAEIVREAMPSRFRSHSNSNASSTQSTHGHGHGYSGGYERERERERDRGGEREREQRGYDRGGYERMGERGVEREREREVQRERGYSQSGGRYRQGQAYDDGRGGYDQRGVGSGGGGGHQYGQVQSPYAPPTNQSQNGSSQGQRQSGSSATHSNVAGNRPSSFPGSAESGVRPDSPVDDSRASQGRLLQPPQTPGIGPANGDGLTSPTRSKQSPMTKRHHALHELLSSERAYASDLALLRDLHIPMALGQTVPFQFMPVSPPTSSASSSRTVSTASDSSVNPANANGNTSTAGATANTNSGASANPPMTMEDTKVIFSNILEIAIFSDNFSVQIEEALGTLIDGGKGEDRVGALFLKVIPELERPYKYYITRHPTALTHLQNIPQTPALQAYYTQTQQIASALTHAWDLASFLIKPVQRLLKYPLLIAAIIDETPDGHPDKDSLREARSRMEEVARNVNEGRRRAEVVKEVLSGGSSGLGGANGGGNGKKKGGSGVNVGVGVAASVNLSKMKNLKALNGNGNAQIAEVEGNEEVLKVEKMHADLKRIDVFAQQFAKNAVDWGKSMAVMVRALRTWALSFGKVIGLSLDNGSDAFDAFIAVVEQHLLPLTLELDAHINERLLKDLAHLLSTMTQPFKLLNSMNEQQPFHYHLLTMPVSAKNRPPASLLAASTNYLALRGQLAAELPTYLGLLHRGLATFVTRLAEIQAVFWCRVRDKWGELWEMLRVEGEMNAGGDETMYVWSMRWGEVEKFIEELRISQQPMKIIAPSSVKTIRMSGSSGGTAAESWHSSPQIPQTPPSYQSYQQSPPSRKGNSAVTNVLSSLEPSTAPLPSSASSTRTTNTRARGSSDASISGPYRRGRRSSVESLRSGNAPPAYQQVAFPHPYANQGYPQQTQSSFHHPSQSPPQSPNALGGGPGSGMSRRKTMDEIPLGSPVGSDIFVGGGYITVTNAVPTQSMLPRTKSMPSAVGKSKSSGSRASGGQSEFGTRTMTSADTEIVPTTPGREGQDTIRARHTSTSDDKDKDKDRGRSQRKPSLKRKLTEAIRPSSSGQRRSTSKPLASPTATEFFASSGPAPPTPSNPSTDTGTVRSHGHSNSISSTNSSINNANNMGTFRPRRDSWEHKSAKYICQVTYPCVPPPHAAYYSFPFFTLQVGEIYEVLKEAGHPSVHPKLPVYVDEGEDCLLLCRDELRRVGWAFASFLNPVGVDSSGEGEVRKGVNIIPR